METRHQRMGSYISCMFWGVCDLGKLCTWEGPWGAQSHDWLSQHIRLHQTFYFWICSHFHISDIPNIARPRLCNNVRNNRLDFGLDKEIQLDPCRQGAGTRRVFQLFYSPPCRHTLDLNSDICICLPNISLRDILGGKASY